MMNGYVRRIISLLLLGLALYVIPISCQSTDNPAFWEGARVYNAQGKPIDNSTKDDIIAISRDFQTIYGLNEQPLSPWVKQLNLFIYSIWLTRSWWWVYRGYLWIIRLAATRPIQQWSN